MLSFLLSSFRYLPKPTMESLQIGVWIWIVLEFFFLAVLHIAKIFVLDKVTTRAPPLRDPLALTRKILDVIDLLDKRGAYSADDFISGFFLGAQRSELKRDNFKSFFAWAFYSKTLPHLKEEEANQIEVCVEECLLRHPSFANVEHGFNPLVKHVNFSMQRDIPYIPRPLCMHVAFGCLQLVSTFLFLRVAQGFRRLELNGMNYWFRSGSKSLPPLVFFHGITPGWSIYSLLISYCSSESRPVFLIDLEPCFIKSLCFRMPTPQVFCDGVMAILERHGSSSCFSLIGHSFGSITAAWMLKAYPQRVVHLTLLDPVCLLLSLPPVAVNFLYRSPSSFVERLIHLCASSELTVSYMLHRNFWWYENTLWLDELPENCKVCIGLATADEIVHSHAVAAYALEYKQLHSHPEHVEVLLFNEYSHGQVLLSETQLSLLSETIHRQEKTIQV